ncbi:MULTISPECIES: hypothetical protein [Halorussus]|uniref:hypothetical protein n=1 Tax=Halorussus TaxID=1070314 RepID=UPI00209E1291|nr:hypothetical protein [Halorussus vallis]USZ76705.1 hypothetical protein NGM07_05100 [Halorussus vallis]
MTEETDGLSGRLDDLASRAEDALDGLGEYVEEPDADLADVRERVGDEDRSVAEAGEHLRDLWDVADEVEDLLQTVDLSDLPEAIDVSELPSAVEAGEVPDAVANGDPGDAVRFRKLLKVVNLTELWDATDVRAFWKQKRELEAELSESFDGEDTGESGNTEVAGDDDDGWLDADRDWSIPETDGPGDFDPESMENAVQSKMMDGVEEFRESLLAAHEKLKALREENRDRMAAQDRSTHSRNPTAHSTVPGGDRPAVGSTARHSTVPRETRYSTAPNKKRVYGDRFDNETDDS